VPPVSVEWASLGSLSAYRPSACCHAWAKLRTCAFAWCNYGCVCAFLQVRRRAAALQIRISPYFKGARSRRAALMGDEWRDHGHSTLEGETCMQDAGLVLEELRSPMLTPAASLCRCLVKRGRQEMPATDVHTSRDRDIWPEWLKNWGVWRWYRFGNSRWFQVLRKCILSSTSWFFWPCLATWQGCTVCCFLHILPTLRNFKWLVNTRYWKRIGLVIYY